MNELVAFSPTAIPVPAIVVDAGASERFLEFFAATIRNTNTRTAYLKACLRFCGWCETLGLSLSQVRPLHVAAYIESLGQSLSKPSVKLNLAAIRQMLGFLVTGGVLPMNVASSVRGPKFSMKKGKTPVLTTEEVRELFQSIDVSTIGGLRDRALIAIMSYHFARIGATLAMNVEDYVHQGRRAILRLHEKGGKWHELPCHHKAEEYIDAYIAAAGIADQKETPLFRTIRPVQCVSDNRLQQREALAMIKRRGVAAGLGGHICNHTFRASGITTFRKNGGTLEKAQEIAAHESPRTTMLYDRSNEPITLDEIERVRF